MTACVCCGVAWHGRSPASWAVPVPAGGMSARRFSDPVTCMQSKSGRGVDPGEGRTATPQTSAAARMHACSEATARPVAASERGGGGHTVQLTARDVFQLEAVQDGPLRAYGCELGLQKRERRSDRVGRGGRFPPGRHHRPRAFSADFRCVCAVAAQDRRWDSCGGGELGGEVRDPHGLHRRVDRVCWRRSANVVQARMNVEEGRQRRGDVRTCRELLGFDAGPE